jgi:hypothetical protein
MIKTLLISYKIDKFDKQLNIEKLNIFPINGYVCMKKLSI